MNVRTVLLVPITAGFALVLAAGFAGLPPSGRARSPVADEIVRTAAPERHALDAVASITFDQRGFDTLGEELILFSSILGVAVLLRRSRHQIERLHRERGEHAEEGRTDDRVPGRAPPETSSAVRILGAGLAGPCVVFAAYLVTHGQLSPGGGFQGGVVAATAPLVVYLSAEAAVFTRIAPRALAEVVEAVGVGGYGAVGVAGLAVAGVFLENVLPLGEMGDVLSSGTIFALNGLVGLAVATGFVVLLAAFLEEALERRLRERR